MWKVGLKFHDIEIQHNPIWHVYLMNRKKFNSLWREEIRGILKTHILILCHNENLLQL